MDSSGGHRVSWKMELDKLDYQFYMPLFFDGLTEGRPPYNYLVEQAIVEMLEANMAGMKVLPILPQLIRPIKSELRILLLFFFLTRVWLMQFLIMILVF